MTPKEVPDITPFAWSGAITKSKTESRIVNTVNSWSFIRRFSRTPGRVILVPQQSNAGTADNPPPAHDGADRNHEGDKGDDDSQGAQFTGWPNHVFK
jgi:hypothetical protein